jgi:hypothetical protein
MIEAMKQALEALEWNLPVIEDYGDKEQLNRQHKAITSLRQAIEQAEKQEPVAWLCERDGQGYSFAYTAEQLHQLGYGNISVPPFRKVAPLYTAPQPQQAEKQEPVKMVAYNCLCGRIMKFESVNGIVAPQREWVGLTDAELAEFSDMELGAYDLCLEVEAKLRSKNT